MTGKSEVAAMRLRIDAESASGQLALTGPAQVSPHSFITARMENLAGVIASLIDEFGEEGAKSRIIEAMERESQCQ